MLGRGLDRKLQRYSDISLKEVRRHDCAGHNIAILRAP